MLIGIIIFIFYITKLRVERKSYLKSAAYREPKYKLRPTYVIYSFYFLPTNHIPNALVISSV